MVKHVCADYWYIEGKMWMVGRHTPQMTRGRARCCITTISFVRLFLLRGTFGMGAVVLLVALLFHIQQKSSLVSLGWILDNLVGHSPCLPSQKTLQRK